MAVLVTTVGLSGGLTGSAPPAWAEEAPAHVVLDKLWTPDSTRAARLRPYVEAHRAAFQSADAAYALALVQSRQRLHTDAEVTLTEALGRHPSDLDLRRFRVVLHLTRRQRDAAVDHLVAWSRTLLATDTPETRDFTWLGQMVGFLTGPLPANGDDERLTAIERLIADSATASQAEAFASGRDELLTMFEQITTRRDESAAAKAADAEQKKQDTVSSFQSEIDELTSRKSAIALEESKLQQDSEANLKQKRDRMTELSQQVAPADAQIALIQTQILQISERIRDYSSVLAASQGNALLMTTTVQQIDALRLQQVALNQEIVGVRARVAPMTREMNRLTGEMQQVTQATNVALTKLRQESAQIDRKLADLKRKMDREQAANRSTGPGDGPRPDALTTYYVFPLEAERDRLLARFAE